MAKRKRLEVPSSDTVAPDLETKSAIFTQRARMPLADVAGEAAGRAALEEVAREMTALEGEGRVVKKLPLASVELHHLSRDRMVLDPDEMAALTASIDQRGQQTPIEVIALPGEKYGLISGLRRVEALQSLGVETVLAMIRKPETSGAAYQAMIEENEIRANLSFYERANIAVAAVGQGVYPNPRAAVKELFAHAPKARRSKILKFVTLCDALGPSLTFPTEISEHLGFKLAQAIEADRKIAKKISTALAAETPADAASERRILEAALAPKSRASKVSEIAPGLRLEARAGRVVMTGEAVDEGFLDALRAWAAERGAC